MPIEALFQIKDVFLNRVNNSITFNKKTDYYDGKNTGYSETMYPAEGAGR